MDLNKYIRNREFDSREEEVRQLLNRISKSDDQQAFKELFDRYQAWLYHVAHSIVKSNEDAEEVLEDVFVKIWDIRDQYHQIRNIETYLYTAVKNKSYDRYRKNLKARHVEIDPNMAEVDYMESPEDIFICQELQVKINESIDSLPSKCREIYLLIKESGLSYKSAAEQLAVSIKTIESQMRIASKKIIISLDQYLQNP